VLSSGNLLVKIGVDTAENEPFKITESSSKGVLLSCPGPWVSLTTTSNGNGFAAEPILPFFTVERRRGRYREGYW